MKAIVTGAAGFVGHTLASRLTTAGHEVVGIDSFTPYYDLSIKEKNVFRITNPRFELLRSDILDLDLPTVLDGVDVIYHQAGQPGVRKSWGAEFSEYIHANISATQYLLEAAKDAPSLKRFVYASSSSVYGDAASYPTFESDPTSPVSPYGVTKLAAEHLCSLYARNFNVPTVSLRYFTVYGPGQRPDMAFTRFLRAAVLDEEIQVFGDGNQIRDFTYIDDIVHANILAGTSDAVEPGSVFNVAGGSNISVNEVLALIEQIIGRPLRVRRTSTVPGDVFRTSGSIDKIVTQLNWQPKTQIAEGLKLHHEWAEATYAKK